MMPTRTDKVPNTSATAASAGTDLNGAAVLDACTQFKQRLATGCRGSARLRAIRRCALPTGACFATATTER